MAGDFHLEITGIEGESKVKGFEGKIQIESWNWGVTNSGSSHHGGGAGAGKSNPQDFSFAMYQSKASPELMSHCALGKHIPEVIFTSRKAGGEQLKSFELVMKEVLVSSYQVGGSSHEDQHLESISFNFASLMMKYKEQNKDGTLGGNVDKGYDWKAVDEL